MATATERTVLITGTSSGIGRACALRLDQAGYRVFAGVRKAEHGEALKKESSARLTPVILDITRADQIAAAREQIAAVLGPERGLDGLVNNAGIASAVGPLAYLPLPAIRHDFEVDVLGPVALTQALLPLLRKACGRIVFIGSPTGRLTMPFLGVYSATKSALEAFANGLRRELTPFGMRVSLLLPSFIQTPMWDKGGFSSDEFVKTLPEDGKRDYAAMFARGWEYMRNQYRRGAVPPTAVADVVKEALEAPRPKAYYYVGPNARVPTLTRCLPIRLVDWLVLDSVRQR